MLCRLNTKASNASSLSPPININEDQIAASKREWEKQHASAALASRAELD
jgi:hypothetical protein